MMVEYNSREVNVWLNEGLPLTCFFYLKARRNSTYVLHGNIVEIWSGNAMMGSRIAGSGKESPFKDGRQISYSFGSFMHRSHNEKMTLTNSVIADALTCLQINVWSIVLLRCLRWWMPVYPRLFSSQLSQMSLSPALLPHHHISLNAFHLKDDLFNSSLFICSSLRSLNLLERLNNLQKFSSTPPMYRFYGSTKSASK